MTPFLKQVADRYFDSGSLAKNYFIFPNRRSMEFFRKYINDAAADSARNAAVPGHCGVARPVIHPRMITMNDFMSQTSGVRVEDRVMLLLRLYNCYKEVYPAAEPLDDFIFWGDVILGDFGDVDKYLADPRKLFRNVADFREIQDTFEYLDEDQRLAIESFVRNFHENGRAKVNMDDDNVKARFARIWNILLPLYERFTADLKKDGAAYEGLAYRAVAERLDRESAVDVLAETYGQDRTYVFVGLNALNECEKKVMRKMRDAGIAEFWWDYSGKMIRDRQNRSSFFMEKNIVDFPPVRDLPSEELGVPEVNVISVPSAVGQTKQVAGIIGQIGNVEEVGRCAVVLPDENLLPSLLNSIPDSISGINVTMGSPMKGGAFYSLMSDLASMQIHIRYRDGKPFLYHRQVWSVLSNSLFVRSMDSAASETAASIRKAAKYYIPIEDFAGNNLFETVFRAVVTEQKKASEEQIAAFEDYQISVISVIAPLLKDEEDISQELEYMRRYLRCVNRLKPKPLPVLPLTYIRLLDQLLSAESVPYEGEPLKGLQVMGPLETRALDFDNIILLSCNEGVFPKRNVASSFIPPELRRGFGLPSYEYQDAVWAYYFYRMIQRASKVWLLFDSRTEGLKGGEESRYIKQLEYHFRLPIRRMMVKGTVRTGKPGSGEAKPENIEHIIKKEKWLSASTLESYLDCQVKFYYSVVCGLKAENEVSESMDAGMLGNVFHNVMQALYLGPQAMEPDFNMERQDVRLSGIKPLERITEEYIGFWLKHEEKIRAKIKALIMKELNSIEVSGRDLVLQDVILNYVRKTLERDLEFIKAKGTLEILGLELYKEWSVDGFRFRGYIDRLDAFPDNVVRIVDYKTGRVQDSEIDINDGNAETVVDALFGEDNEKRPKIAMQLFLYDMYMLGDDRVNGRLLSNCIYSVANMYSALPEVKTVSGKFCELMKEHLSALLSEIVNPALEFKRTDNVKTCGYCDFKTICGR